MKSQFDFGEDRMEAAEEWRLETKDNVGDSDILGGTSF